MLDKAVVGQKIFALRKNLGVTQDNLAVLVNVTPQAISKWENGAALPDTGLLPVLAELFHTSIEELLCVSTGNNPEGQRENTRVMLPGLKYHPCMPPLIGCIKSSLDYLGIHVSTGWISAPYAFMLNINEEVSVKGPEFWNDGGCFDELIRNCGGIVRNFQGFKGECSIAQKRREAWDIIRDSVDKGFPCYAWELDRPLYYLIAGYDGAGYYYIDPDSMAVRGPKPYGELGESEWGVLEIHVIRPGSISDNLKTLKDVFEYAINVCNPDIHRPNPGYTMGTDAYRVWWEAVCKGTADCGGMAYNASFWARCKNLAAQFLQEGKLRIGIMEDLFDRAISDYENAARSLTRLSRLFPLNLEYDRAKYEQYNDQAVRLLKAAQRSEINGLSIINDILEGIYKIW